MTIDSDATVPDQDTISLAKGYINLHRRLPLTSEVRFELLRNLVQAAATQNFKNLVREAQKRPGALEQWSGEDPHKVGDLLSSQLNLFEAPLLLDVSPEVLSEGFAAGASSMIESVAAHLAGDPHPTSRIEQFGQTWIGAAADYWNVVQNRVDLSADSFADGLAGQTGQ